jgi:HTH-type transcriptional regulator/antitoxin HigA
MRDTFHWWVRTGLVCKWAEADYFTLVQRFPLRPIHSSGELYDAINMINELIDQPDLSPDALDYLDVLDRLVEDYEEAHVDIPDVRGTAALRHLMKESGLQQKDLAHLFGSKSAISEVLSNKRELSKPQIQQLRDYFAILADVFIG